MVYAAELRSLPDYTLQGNEENPERLFDMVVELLLATVRGRLRQGLTPNYTHREADLTRLRGRFDALRTAEARLLQRGMVACQYQELTVDTPLNRFVHAAIVLGAQKVRDNALRKQCTTLARQMSDRGVSSHASRAHATRFQLGRHDARDGGMLAAAKLVFDLTIPDEQSATHPFPAPEREESWVRRLYERAVAGFYRSVLTDRGWRVRAQQPLAWNASHHSDGITEILPNMVADVVLELPAKTQRVVVETKFTNILTKSRFREVVLRSGHLYQIYAYLRSQESIGLTVGRAAGVLLHPAVDLTLSEQVVIDGHPIRFATVDLAGPTAGIREQLLAVLSIV